MINPERIEKPKVILVEGQDAYWFFIWASIAYQLEDVQVRFFEGVSSLKQDLSLLRLLPGFENIISLLVVRDAETDANGAIQSVRHALQHSNFTVPTEPYQLATGSPNVAYAILPGSTTVADGVTRYDTGALEDLCLSTVSNSALLSHVDTFLNQAVGCGCEIRRFHKAKLYACLSAQDSYVGLKLGEAARVGAWDWNHGAMVKLKTTMLAM